MEASHADRTIGRLLRAGADYLVAHGIEAQEAQTQAEILLAEGLKCSALALHLNAHKLVDEPTVELLRKTFQRVARGEPIQYVVGHWPFHAIELKTDARALIPRPETEQLVERILHHPVWARAQSVADIGVGTGAIILSLAHASGSERTFTGVDLSPDALALAQENAAALGLDARVDFRLGDGCAPLAPNSVDILVSNPPYIAAREVDALPPLIRAHEPRMALDGGADGLDILRQIVLDATQVLRPGGRLFLEIGEDQGLALQRLLECAGYTEVVIAKDFAGHDRYAEGSLP